MRATDTSKENLLCNMVKEQQKQVQDSMRTDKEHFISTQVTRESSDMEMSLQDDEFRRIGENTIPDRRAGLKQGRRHKQ